MFTIYYYYYTAFGSYVCRERDRKEQSGTMAMKHNNNSVICVHCALAMHFTNMFQLAQIFDSYCDLNGPIVKSESLIKTIFSVHISLFFSLSLSPWIHICFSLLWFLNHFYCNHVEIFYDHHAGKKITLKNLSLSTFIQCQKWKMAIEKNHMWPRSIACARWLCSAHVSLCHSFSFLVHFLYNWMKEYEYPRMCVCDFFFQNH